MMRYPMSTPLLHGKLFIRSCALVCVLAFSGCATYSNSFETIEQNLASRQYDAALKTIEAQSQNKRERVLYLLNKGMVLRMKHDYVASNQSLEEAKQQMDKLYAASISQNALTFVINDATVSYAGEDYEQVLVHLYMALNYLELGQRDEARVEVLQVDIKLREIAEKFPASKFTEDALSRYLSGMIYEELAEWSDAMIAYRKAYEAYQKYQSNFAMPVPPMLKYDLIRLAQREGLSDELAQYRKEFGIGEEQEIVGPTQPQGELVFILNNGLAPIKRERAIDSWTLPPPVVVVPTPAQTQSPPILVTIALPYYESRPMRAVGARISVSGKQADTQMVEDVDAIARASLDARMPAITARAVARAVAKGVLQESVDNAGGKNDDALAKLIGSFLVRVFSVATERADTRSWLTLPANVQLARLALPPGTYDVTVELLGANGQVIATNVFPQVTIRDARKTYLTQHSMP